MQVDRFCRKFERILDDRHSYDNKCDPCCLDQGGLPCDNRLDRDSELKSHSRFRNPLQDNSNYHWYKNPLFIGFMVAIGIALLILLIGFSNPCFLKA